MQGASRPESRRRIGTVVIPITPTGFPRRLARRNTLIAVPYRGLLRALVEIHAIRSAYHAFYETGGDAEGALVEEHVTFCSAAVGAFFWPSVVIVVTSIAFAAKLHDTICPVHEAMELPRMGEPSKPIPMGEAADARPRRKDIIRLLAVLRPPLPVAKLVL